MTALPWAHGSRLIITTLSLITVSLLSVFSPTELLYTRAEGLEVSSSTPVVIPWIASPLAAQDLAKTDTEESETLTEMADRIAGEYGIPSTTLRNLVYSESRWNPDAESKTGDCGLAQINDTLNPSGKGVPCEQAKDPAYALDFAARYIKAGQADRWVACNCYLLVKAKIPLLPLMKDVLPNTTPHVGAVAIFEYTSTKGAYVKHIALITSIAAEGFTVLEANKQPCLIGSRFIRWDDPRLVGFFAPGATGASPQ